MDVQKQEKKRMKIYGFIVPAVPLPLFYSLSVANVNSDSFCIFSSYLEKLIVEMACSLHMKYVYRTQHPVSFGAHKL